MSVKDVNSFWLLPLLSPHTSLVTSLERTRQKMWLFYGLIKTLYNSLFSFNLFYLASRFFKEHAVATQLWMNHIEKGSRERWRQEGGKKRKMFLEKKREVINYDLKIKDRTSFFSFFSFVKARGRNGGNRLPCPPLVFFTSSNHLQLIVHGQMIEQFEK